MVPLEWIRELLLELIERRLQFPIQHQASSQRDPALPLPEGVIAELADGIPLDTYQEKLQRLVSDLDTLPRGISHSRQFEDIAGETIRLCFYRSLANVKPRVRTINGTVVRHWVASNVAPSGFGECFGFDIRPFR